MDTNWRARRRREKAQRCCRDAPSAAGAAGTSASDMPRDEEGRKPGMSVIVHMLRVGEPNCQSIAGQVSPQNENVRFVQSRNVRFHGWTRAPWKRSESP